MAKTDYPARPRGEADNAKDAPGREDTERSFGEFVRPRRPRTHSSEKLDRGQRPADQPAAPRRELHSSRGEGKPYRDDKPFRDKPLRDREGYSRGQSDDRPRKPRPDAPHGEVRRSFNPNFDRDNRPVFEAKPRKEWAPREDGRRDDSRREDNRRDGDRRTGKPARPDQRQGWKPREENGRFNAPDRKFNKGDRRKPTEKGSHVVKDAESYPRFAAPRADGPVRLNRYIAQSGVCSRREADEYIASGVVTVNGQVVSELGYKVMPGDQVRLNDKVLQGEKKVYIVMNKPKGFVTSLEDPHADRTVMDLLGDAVSERVYPVGRLDKNSLGVLLITNDGDLTKRLTHPSYNKRKVYQVSLDKALTHADMERIATGIELEDGPIAADAIDWVGESKKEVGIEIHSGRNRIVRRIFESLGYHVAKLDRVYFAGLTKQRLKRGQWRFLTPKEVVMLKSGEYE